MTRYSALVFLATCTAGLVAAHALGEEPRKAAKTVPSYEIISDDSVNAGQLRDVWVRIAKPLSEADVRRIAARVKAMDRKKHPKTSIAFLLPAMEKNKGAWARAVYRPQLEVMILGLDEAEHAALVGRGGQKENTVGRWLRSLPSSSYTITITMAADGSAVATHTYPNGDKQTYELEELTPRRKYRRKDAQFGEFQLINGEGNLELWDDQGRIETLPKAQ